MSLREDILKDDHLDREPIEEFDTAKTVYLQEMRGSDGQFFENELVADTDEQGNPVEMKDYARSRLLVRCIVDENGDRVLEDDDAKLLENKSHRLLDSLFVRLMEISSPEGVNLGDLEELAGNSVTSP